ncbi:MAG: imidazole glycerol phosphate synthase subunit HisH [Elusimicrobia bacterium]|nr:imidazole glycerol phosphate synthase subunit HisH [Elusimicrobiota bacterium]
MTRKTSVVVIDYGLGNLFSILRALQRLGAQALLSRDPKTVFSAGRIILPGVGAFGDGMKGLSENSLIEPIKAFAQSGRPILGICLGMQLLMEEGTEFGLHQGLGIVRGGTASLSRSIATRSKVPHVGWNLVRPPKQRNPGPRPWEGTILAGLPVSSYFYFVHSFVVVPADPAERIAETAHAGSAFCSALHSGSVSGCQFHPEKSGPAGLKVLRNFLALRPSSRRPA